MMAYIQVKHPERDTTSKMWRMLRSVRRDGSDRAANLDMSEMVRESTNLAIREALEEWRLPIGFPGTAADVCSVRRSYTGVASAPGAGVPHFLSFASLGGSMLGPRHAVETIEVTPYESMSGRLIHQLGVARC